MLFLPLLCQNVSVNSIFNDSSGTFLFGRIEVPNQPHLEKKLNKKFSGKPFNEENFKRMIAESLWSIKSEKKFRDLEVSVSPSELEIKENRVNLKLIVHIQKKAKEKLVLKGDIPKFILREETGSGAEISLQKLRSLDYINIVSEKKVANFRLIEFKSFPRINFLGGAGLSQNEFNGKFDIVLKNLFKLAEEFKFSGFLSKQRTSFDGRFKVYIAEAEWHLQRGLIERNSVLLGLTRKISDTRIGVRAGYEWSEEESFFVEPYIEGKFITGKIRVLKQGLRYDVKAKAWGKLLFIKSSFEGTTIPGENIYARIKGYPPDSLSGTQIGSVILGLKFLKILCLFYSAGSTISENPAPIQSAGIAIFSKRANLWISYPFSLKIPMVEFELKI